MIRYFVWTLFYLSLSFPTLIGAAESFKFQHQVSPNVGTVGDIFKYDIRFTYPPSIQVNKPIVGKGLKDFTILDYEIDETDYEDGSISYVLSYQLARYVTGNAVIPTFSIQYRVKKGSRKTKTLPPIALHVASVLKSGDSANISDIKPPFAYIAFNLGLLFLIASLIASGTSYFIWRHFRKRKRVLKQHYLSSKKDPAFIAKQSLNVLIHKNFLAKKKHRSHFIHLTKIFKLYLTRKYKFDAIDLTSQEILDHLSQDFDHEQLKRIKGLLEICDRVKFAAYQPSPDETEQAHTRFSRIIQAPSGEDTP